MTKKELRIKYKALRNTLTPEEAENNSLAIANRLLELDIWQHSYYHLFLSIEAHKEINTEFILHILAAKDKEIVIPKSDFETCSINSYLLTDNTTLIKNAYGIPEPVNGLEVPHHKLDVVFVPLLAFDRAGHRTGYGKGFYDRFLSLCRPNVLKVGLSFFEAEEKIDDAGTHDIVLDYCVTPERVYSFI